MSVCIKCGTYKQSPLTRCICGFKPARGSEDEARSFLLTVQFRTPEELENNRRVIESGGELEFTARELELALKIGRLNARVTVSFLFAAVLAGITVGALVAGVRFLVTLALAAVTAAGFAYAFRRMRNVDRLVASVRSDID